MNDKEYRASLLEAFTIKTTAKQQVARNTRTTFALLKKVLKQLVTDYTKMLKGNVPEESLPYYAERGPFEVELIIGGDLLIFSMHSNVFEFDQNHPIWQMKYIEEDVLRSYCGTIHIYNFLADSFKYNRINDLGYLVARIFINKDKHIYVEGKRQSVDLVKDFALDAVSPGILRQVVETTIQYCIEFDLLVPPFDQVKVATVEQMMEKISHSKMQTGKRLGFSFNADDVRIV